MKYYIVIFIIILHNTFFLNKINTRYVVTDIINAHNINLFLIIIYLYIFKIHINNIKKFTSYLFLNKL